jgi:hypothetical protein
MTNEPNEQEPSLQQLVLNAIWEASDALPDGSHGDIIDWIRQHWFPLFWSRLAEEMRVEMAWKEYAREIGEVMYQLNYKMPPWEPALGCGKRYAIGAAQAWKAEHPEEIEYYRKKAERRRTGEAEHKEERDFDFPF